MGEKFLYTLGTYLHFLKSHFSNYYNQKATLCYTEFSIQKIILYLAFSNTFKNIFFDGTKILKKIYKRQHFHKNSARMIPILVVISEHCNLPVKKLTISYTPYGLTLLSDDGSSLLCFWKKVKKMYDRTNKIRIDLLTRYVKIVTEWQAGCCCF